MGHGRQGNGTVGKMSMAWIAAGRSLALSASESSSPSLALTRSREQKTRQASRKTHGSWQGRKGDAENAADRLAQTATSSSVFAAYTNVCATHGWRAPQKSRPNSLPQAVAWQGRAATQRLGCAGVNRARLREVGQRGIEGHRIKGTPPR